MSSVQIRDVRKSFGTFEVLHGVSIPIDDGEFVVLVGPSGCGKSTLLRMLAGLENITSGTISIGERVVNNVQPKERDIAMVFQNYALYPHMTVADNMGFSLKLRGAGADEIKKGVAGVVEQIGTPLDLYDRPENQFVAGFIGSPAMNFLKGKVKANGSAAFEGPNGVRLPLKSVPANSDGRPAVYGIRPEHFTIADDGTEAEIIVVEPTGSETQVFAKLGGEQVVAVFRERHQFNPGEKIRLKPDPSLVHLFDEATGKRLNA